MNWVKLHPAVETCMKGFWFDGLIPKSPAQTVCVLLLVTASGPTCCVCGPAERGIWNGGHWQGEQLGWEESTMALIYSAVGLAAAELLPVLCAMRRCKLDGLWVCFSVWAQAAAVRHPVSWLFFFALNGIFHARLLLHLQSLLCSSRPWRPLFSLTMHGCSWAPCDAAPLLPCPGCPMEGP